MNDFEYGKVLVEIAKIQKTMELVQEKAREERYLGDWEKFGHHMFQLGRLCQRLHSFNDQYSLGVRIPRLTLEVQALPKFLSQKTRDDFPEVVV